MRRLAALVCLCVALAACGDTAADDTAPGATGASDAALDVVATTTVVGDFAREVGGARVSVEVLLDPNVDAHDYEPSPADLEHLRHADVVLRNGVGLDEWLDDAIRSSGSSATIVDTSEGVTHRRAGGEHHDHDGEHDHDGDDPHIWHDPRNAIVMVDNIAASFSSADPDGVATYQRNRDDYVRRLEQLDAEIQARIASLTNKKLVTNHNAFGHYIDRYGLELVGSVIPSFDSSAELSAADLDELVRAIRDEGVKAVFAESSLPGDAARTIAAEAGVTVVTGDDALYGDGLGPEGSGAATYIDMMRHNTETIVSNLR